MACRWLQQLNPLLPPLWHAPVLSAFEKKNNEFSVSCFSSFLQQIFIENLPVSGTILRLKGWNRKWPRNIPWTQSFRFSESDCKQVNKKVNRIIWEGNEVPAGKRAIERVAGRILEVRARIWKVRKSLECIKSSKKVVKGTKFQFWNK